MNEEEKKQLNEIIFDIIKRMDDIDSKIMKLLDLKQSKLIKKLINNLSIEIELLDERIYIIERIIKK